MQANGGGDRRASGGRMGCGESATTVLLSSPASPQFLLDDPRGPLGLQSPTVAVRVHHFLQVVDIPEDHVGQVINARLDVPRDGDVDQDERLAGSAAQHALQVVLSEDGARRVSRADDDVGVAELIGERIERDSAASEALYQFPRGANGSIGDAGDVPA